jgi:hypothetical protein
LYERWETGIVHLRGAKIIVHQHTAELFKTPLGKKLLQLFSRLEMAASRQIIIDDHGPGIHDEDHPPFDSENIHNPIDGNSEFEFAWNEMMKVMVPITILRMVPHSGDKGTLERKAEGERIHTMLHEWEYTLPPSFASIPSPDHDIMEPPYLTPIYFSSLDVSVAMGEHTVILL